jgi:hypothetical protein
MAAKSHRKARAALPPEAHELAQVTDFISTRTS